MCSWIILKPPSIIMSKFMKHCSRIKPVVVKNYSPVNYKPFLFSKLGPYHHLNLLRTKYLSFKIRHHILKYTYYTMSHYKSCKTGSFVHIKSLSRLLTPLFKNKLVSSIDVAGILLFFFSSLKSHVIQKPFTEFILCMFSPVLKVDAKQLLSGSFKMFVVTFYSTSQQHHYQKNRLLQYHILSDIKKFHSL
jgi:hypothetical protein